MKTRLAIIAGAAMLITLGGWLWLHNGVPVWLEGAVAFCA